MHFTPKEQELYDFIKAEVDATGVRQSIAKMQAHMKSSKTRTCVILYNLKKKGFIKETLIIEFSK